MGKEIERHPEEDHANLQSLFLAGHERELKGAGCRTPMIVSKSKTLDVHVPKRASSEQMLLVTLQDMSECI